MNGRLMFGANLDPVAEKLKTTLAVAQVAEADGLDLALSQDHPYVKDHLDAWTLITTVAAQTSRVHIGTNVANLPLRTPTLLAKMATSLDVISGGRVELGIGAGAFWRGILAYGGRDDLQEMPFTAFKEGLAILRGMWAASGQAFRFEGEVYDVPGAGAGPTPAHPIRIWVGGQGPKMLRLIGEQADGVSLSTSYV
ncbi:MAG TPA: LLM class flavin-dependent oxidoreductase, partial [Aggregatilineaceae bacterium]|nr:LLM class flavin-dependent oxidoreductase [Aggregatilineaceae bacterium]